MSKLLINDQNKVLVGSNGKAYAVGNMDVLKGATSPVDFSAAAGRILRLMRYGKCEQNGTPTPSAPVDIVCNNGALKYSPNMANVNEQTASVGYYINSQGAVLADIYNWFYQEYIRVKPNTTYTLSMSQPVYYITISEYSTAEDSGFVIRNAGRTGGNTSLTITTGANTNFIRFGSNINRVVVTMEMVLGINWMLVPGSSVVPYIPYVEGGIYIDGTPEVLTVGGKNLFDIDTVGIEQGAISSLEGRNTASNYRVRTVGYVPVKPSTQYTISAVIDGYTSGSSRGVFVLEYAGESVDDYIGNSGWKSPDGYTFTTGATTNFVRVVFAKEPSSSSYSPTIPEDVTNVQLEEGSAATAYEPYVTPQTVSVPMLLGVGNYKDEAELIHGLLTHKIGIMVFDGTEDWTAYTSSTLVIQNATSAWGAVAGVGGYCTHLTVLKAGETTFAGSCRFATALNVYEYKTAFGVANVAGFKAKLAEQYAAGTPVIILYPLATETTENVTPQPLNTGAGTNTLTDTAEVSNPEYNVTYKI